MFHRFQDSGNKKLLPLFLALLAIFVFDRVYENCRIELYDSETPMVFIGGVKGSGTEYIRDLLDTSKDISCQRSTIGSPALLWMVFNELRREKEKSRLSLAGISEDLIFQAAKEGILEIIFGTRQRKMPCLEEPMILNQMPFLAENFAKAKFINIKRNAFQVANALINDKENIYQTDANPPVLKLSRFQDGLAYWNESVTIVDEFCKKYQKRCITVEHDDLFQHSNIIARKLGKFLKIDLDRNWKPDPIKIFPQKSRAGSKELKKIIKKNGLSSTKRALFLLSNVGWEDNLKYEEALDSFERPEITSITEKDLKIIDDLVKNVNFDRYQNILKLSEYEKLIRFYRNL